MRRSSHEEALTIQSGTLTTGVDTTAYIEDGGSDVSDKSATLEAPPRPWWMSALDSRQRGLSFRPAQTRGAPREAAGGIASDRSARVPILRGRTRAGVLALCSRAAITRSTRRNQLGTGGRERSTGLRARGGLPHSAISPCASRGRSPSGGRTGSRLESSPCNAPASTPVGRRVRYVACSRSTFSSTPARKTTARLNAGTLNRLRLSR